MSDQGQNPPEPEYPKFPGEGSAEGAPPPPPNQPASVPAQPSSISNAVKLMWVGAAFAVVSTVLAFMTGAFDKSAVAEQLRESDPNATQSQIDVAYTSGITIAIVVTILSVVLWSWMAWKNGQGRSWARIVATVLGALGIFSSLGSFAFAGLSGTGGGAVGIVTGLIQIALAVVILVLLWKKESSDYYTAVSQSQVVR